MDKSPIYHIGSLYSQQDVDNAIAELKESIGNFGFGYQKNCNTLYYLHVDKISKRNYLCYRKQIYNIIVIHKNK